MQRVSTGALRATELYGPPDPRVISRERSQEARARARRLRAETKLLHERCARTYARARATRDLLESSRRPIGMSRTLFVLSER